MIDSKDCLVHLSSGKKAIIQGMEDAIIVESGDKMLIMNRADEQDLKKFMKKLD